MPSEQTKDKPEPFRCRYCNKKIKLAPKSTLTWNHEDTGESWSDSPVGHNATPKSRKKKKS